MAKFVFDYDMAIALPFKRPRAGAAIRHVAAVRGARAKAAAASSAAAKRPAVGRSGGKDAGGRAGAKFVAVPGVGHAPELDEPEAVAAIDAFLDQLNT